MDNDTGMVKATLAAAVLRAMITPGAAELKTKIARGTTLKAVADVTDELFTALFDTKR